MSGHQAHYQVGSVHPELGSVAALLFVTPSQPVAKLTEVWAGATAAFLASRQSARPVL
jgi:hypothetical protein